VICEQRLPAGHQWGIRPFASGIVHFSRWQSPASQASGVILRSLGLSTNTPPPCGLALVAPVRLGACVLNTRAHARRFGLYRKACAAAQPLAQAHWKL
jgi:hypothetical protein